MSASNVVQPFSPEAGFWDVIGTKGLRILLPPLSLSKSGLKLVCNVNIIYRNFKSENSQDYAQKPQRNCTSCIRLQEGELITVRNIYYTIAYHWSHIRINIARLGPIGFLNYE
jgi:hypothetical protein